MCWCSWKSQLAYTSHVHLCGVFKPSALATLEVGTSLSSGAELTPPLSSKDKTTTQSVYELCFYIHRSAPRGVQNGLERFWWVQDGSYCVRTLLIGSERFLQDVGHKNKTSKKRERSRCTKIQWMGPLLYDAFQSGKVVLEQQRAH